jgi:hypothetical protein
MQVEYLPNKPSFRTLYKVLMTQRGFVQVACLIAALIWEGGD